MNLLFSQGIVSRTNNESSRSQLASLEAVLDASDQALNSLTLMSRNLDACAPKDEILGCESGLHLDKESNVIVLLGRSKAYAIALPSLEVMFHWRDQIRRFLEDHQFHVTLLKSSSFSPRSKLSPGLQALMHIQNWRLCLVSEPSEGSKLICQWRLDAVDNAYVLVKVGEYPKLILEANAFAGKVKGSFEFELDPLAAEGIINNLERLLSKQRTEPSSQSVESLDESMPKRESLRPRPVPRSLQISVETGGSWSSTVSKPDSHDIFEVDEDIVDECVSHKPPTPLLPLPDITLSELNNEVVCSGVSCFAQISQLLGLSYPK
ncbi:Protein Dok-7 [Cichlidogyrus casuarinus]|uniref:Protein Dok-7 n=1 Tax=Cichlidogyrus casuarinus TaxID=1844966 RepID=A0ABD2QGT2_9PLAT